MPWFNLITGALGEQNPYDEASAWSDAAQKRNRAAVGLDANGNPLPTNLDANGNPVAPPPPADPNNPVNNGQSAAMGQALATGVQQPGQQPQATKTDPSLGHILMDMTQYQQREQGFNQAMGAGFAAFSQPRDREWVSKIFNVNEPDPTKLMQQEQDLASQQQGQDRMNSLGAMINDPVQGAAIAKRLNISQAELIARYRADPQGVGNMIQQFAAPTDQMKNLQQIQYYSDLTSKQQGMNPADLDSLKTAITAGIAPPDAYAMISAQIAWRNKHGANVPPPWTPNDPASFKQFTANEAAKEDDRTKASATLPQTQQTAEELRGNLETLRDMPGLKSILGNFAKQQAAREALQNQNVDLAGVVARGALTKDEANAVSLLRKIGGAQTAEALHSLVGTGTRVTQQEVGPLTAAIGTTQDLNQDFGTYVNNAINPLITRTKKLVATTYGASGNFHGMDDEYKPWVPAIFRKNAGGGHSGELYKEGSGAEDIPDLGPVPDDQLAAAKAHLKDVPVDRGSVLDHLQQQGYDVSKLRKTDPSKW